METAAKVLLNKVQRKAEEIKNGDMQIFPEAAKKGDSVRQGDIYITYLEHMPKEVERIEPQVQLAPGSTRGSRHCLDSVEGVSFFNKIDATVLDGPILSLTKTRTITHPEHGDWQLFPGVYQITYQRAYAEELKRVID